MLHRKFAVIKFWPRTQSAEDEFIERLKIAAESIGLKCLVVDSFARLINPPNTPLTKDDVDFVISPHFEAPKQFDIFSFVTLWNPVQFYHEWGYRKFTRHLLTHDDFLSCDSTSGDDHVGRFIANDPMRDGPRFRIYPTLSGPILEPTLGDNKLFYVGINWERLTNKNGRHDEFLRLLDRDGDLRLYGPKLFSGVDVWEGFHSYVGPIPFDGVSVVRLIHKAGISLVLSSKAHRDAKMMSCRIFESAAAGAVIICDDNAFARRFFGDCLLYIDTSLPPQETHAQVQAHLDWIKTKPGKAIELAREAQEIFRANFKLDSCLKEIYAGLSDRKRQLECLYTPKIQERICVIFLMPEFRAEQLEQHIHSFLAQKNVSIRGIVAMDASDAELFGPRVRARLNQLSVPLEMETAQFTERYPNGSVKQRKRIGEVLTELVGRLVQEDYFCVVAPGERLFSDHCCSLLRTLQDADRADSAWADMLASYRSDGRGHADLTDEPDVRALTDGNAIGFGRFLFRTSAFDRRLRTALPYVDSLAMHLMFGVSRGLPTKRCTLISDAPTLFPAQSAVMPADLEREILIDYSPLLFKQDAAPAQPQPAAQPPQRMETPTVEETQHLQPQSLSLDHMNPEARTKLAVELAHSVPFPPLLKRIAFGLYRIWFRNRSRA